MMMAVNGALPFVIGGLLGETWKVLIGALIGGFVAVAITEPLKQWLQNLTTLRHMRKNLDAEMAHNLTELYGLFNSSSRTKLRGLRGTALT